MQYRIEVNDIEEQCQHATDLGKVVTRLQLERGDVAFYIWTNNSMLITNLTNRFTVTNEAINNMTTWTEIIIPALQRDSDNETEEEGEVLLNRTTFILRLNDFRSQIVSEDNRENNVFEAMLWYKEVNNVLLDYLTSKIKESDKSGIWRYLIGFKNLIRAIENIGVSAVYGINYFGRGTLSKENYVNYIKYDVLGKDLLNSSFIYVPYLKDEYKNLTNFPEYGSIKNMSKRITQNRLTSRNNEAAITYYRSMTHYIERLRTLHSSLRRRIKEEVSELLKEASDKEALGIMIVVTVVIVSPIIIIFMRNAVATIQLYSMNLAEKAKELRLEQKKSDAILFQMLPTSVAIKLKQTRQVPAEYFESVTVYFSDIVRFTEIASFCTPLEVCSFLNSIYKVFDERIAFYDVYKVETIGDAYMVASGLPERMTDKKHVSEIATMALDLLQASSCFKIPHSTNEKLEIRIGIHTGPCGAGIVGTKMPRYCLFGNTVNVASRMESCGAASKIHITSEVNDELMKIGGFKTELRGLIEVKGKGLMKTYWLTCRDAPILNFKDNIAENLERAIALTDNTIEQASNDSWLTESGETIKQTVLSNLSISRESLLQVNYSTFDKHHVLKYIYWHNLLNEHLIKQLSQRIGHSVSGLPVWRQVIAYKNLIEASEHISIAMILAVSFLMTDQISIIDYREFIRTYALSQEQLISASHFLHRKSIFDTEIELEMLKWYTKIFEIFASSSHDAIDVRHELIDNNSSFSNVDKSEGYECYQFMKKKIIPEIKKFQYDVKQNVRTNVANFSHQAIETTTKCHKHASEIAFMSLDLLVGVSNFCIPHRPYEKVRIRVGVNSGPCVAGVVGTSMPRYCLFAMKIHVSATTKELLDEHGGFILEKRGTIEIKGKGEMETFWLLGHEQLQGTQNLMPLQMDEIFQSNIFEPEFLQII
ncbi:hypothetical protein PVAND_012840 [Polypedilum vanderplanki]|uniref:Guanylate cyclase domain-containing protein n=1 Tax=Polypedilum vanderplanki TaxID=319348 RepID=A0A9J6CNX3_POLVA|nr:hypothetical protein PVAND_012840 [Polypedilum vanderplanki]